MSHAVLSAAIDVLLREIILAEAPQDLDHWHEKRQRPPTLAPSGVRSRLWEFFDASDTSFGVFYPKRHIIVIFPAFEAARRAEVGLHDLGFTSHELRAIPASEMIEFLSELRSQTGLWGALMAQISQTFGTEEVFVHDDIRLAQEGAGFLAIYCPADTEAAHIRQALEPYHPLAMQRYLATGIESLI